MHDQPVTTTEIADLIHRIRLLAEDPHANPAERAEVLAAKADLLAQLAEQRAYEWTCEHAEQAHEIAENARAIADKARQAAAHLPQT
jgi:methyl-accepting chemotaxis protein